MKSSFYIPMLSLVLLAGCGKEPVETAPIVRPVKVVTAGERSVEKRDVTGTVQASQRVELSFQVPGRIVEFPVKEGQKVKEGEILARVDDSDYRSKVAAMQAEVNKSRSNFDRAEELLEGNFVSQADYDQIKASYEVSVAQLEQAEKALKDTQLVAPFDGSIAKTVAENFEDVRANQPILSLQDTGDLEIVVSVSETLVARRQAVAQVSLVARFDALPDRTFDLYIKEFATEADSRTLSFAYVLGISDKNIGNILPGMSAIVTATRFRESASGPMVIPLSAVVAGIDDAPSVWKVDASNSVKKHPVTVGRLVEADQVEINSGITPGDVIVVVGSASLTEGMQVNPVNEVKF